MKKLLIGIFALILSACAGTPTQPTQQEYRANVRQYVVPLMDEHVIDNEDTNETFKRMDAFCSATKILRNGKKYLLSAAHCAPQGTTYTADDPDGHPFNVLGIKFDYRDTDGKMKEATIVKSDTGVDLLLLSAPTAVCPCVTQYAVTEDLSVDTPVIAVGYPHGDEIGNLQVVTEGEALGMEDQILFIHTAHLQHGNSGGGLFLRDGRYIGVNVQIVAGGGFLMGTYEVDWLSKTVNPLTVQQFLEEWDAQRINH